MKCLSTLEITKDKDKISYTNIDTVKEGITYGISWSPIEENRLVAATYVGKILLWDTLNSKVMKEVKPGSSQPVHRIEWNREFPEFIASGSKEGFL